MQKHEKKFINELGNEITVRVEETNISGIKGVSVSIIGPTSDTENHLTIAEAQVVHEQLSLTLNNLMLK